MTRANVWRQRLDSTTNWAVVTTGATLSFAFSAPNNTHLLILINTLLITLFLIIEARRYRYYELWSYRLRLLETDLFAAMLVPPFEPRPKWATLLAESLLTPHFTISIWEAMHPFPLQSWDAFLRRAAVGPVPGEVILAAGILFNAIIFAIGWLTTGLTQASGEVLQPSDLPLPARLAHRLGELATNLIEDGAWRTAWANWQPISSKMAHQPSSNPTTRLPTSSPTKAKRWRNSSSTAWGVASPR